ncbi:MAG: proline dehydrogenase, partial [Candidatus Rokubacteria bacterium]|nr:proline dehydrogenase [Candidatus Rokubacteria bacterium]
MIRRLLLYLSTKPSLGRHLERFTFTRRVVRRFVAGETVGEALAVIGELERRGLLTAVTYLGENVTTPKEAQ